jgi:hypothetical protein
MTQPSTYEILQEWKLGSVLPKSGRFPKTH